MKGVLLATLSSAALLLGAPSPAIGQGVAVPTLGGKQFWADERFLHQWRIQRNVLTDHCRLLDESDRRHAWGSFDHCVAELETIKRREQLPPMKGTAVIVLHGLGRSRASMDKLCDYLREQGRFTVFNVSYPSTRRPVADHARSLTQLIEHLEGIDRIHFVAHSMGNIVIRHYLADQTDEAADRHPDPRFGRMVMLGPPNHGSLAARALSENNLFTTVHGQAGQELGRDWAKLEPKLATPRLEFGVIAGGRRDDGGFNPLLPGDDDGTVTVASTRLAGASDFIVVPVLHFRIMSDERVIRYTLHFLQHGYFTTPEERRAVIKTENKK